MLNNVQIKKREEGYCVLHKEDKGFYLSKVEIARSLNFEPVETGSKKDCENFINNKSGSNIVEMEIHIKQNQIYPDSVQDTAA